MSRERPWYKRFPANFIHGVRGLDLEVVGAYSLLLDHMNDRHNSLPDDPRFIAGLLGCPVQRWKKIRAILLDHGKLTLDGDRITNARFERERAERKIERAEAAAHGRAGGLKSAAMRDLQSAFDLDDVQPDGTIGTPEKNKTDTPRTRARAQGDAEIDKKLEKSSKKNETFSENFSGQSDVTPQNSLKNSKGTLKPCARAIQSPRGIEEEKTSPSARARTRTREGDEPAPPKPDIIDQYNAVCDAAGFRPTSPAVIDRSIRVVQAWVDEGIDLDTTILPAIRRSIMDSSEPTRSLNRFRAAIIHEHAKQAASKANGKRYVPPATPVLEPDGEDERFRPVRMTLLQLVGPTQYAASFNGVTFELADERTVQIRGPAYLTESLKDRLKPTLMTVLKRQGIDRLW